MKNQTTKTEQELENWEQEFMDMLTKAYWSPPFEHDLREAWITKKSIEFIKKLIQNEREKVLKRVDKEVIGDEDLLRNKKDMLPNQYHRAKGRNELRSEQHKKLAALASERKVKV